MEKRPNIAVIVCLVILLTGVVSVLMARGQGFLSKDIQGTSYVPPAVKANASQETTVGSSDGKWSLKMGTEKGKEGTTYIFSVSNLADGSQKEIFRKTIPAGSTLSIPANTFSPDGKYVFLKQSGSQGTEYLVLSASGASLTKDSSVLEISGLFTAKFPDYVITEATGWGGVNLIVFNTAGKSGAQGSSFWFEVPSGAFIRLSNRFN